MKTICKSLSALLLCAVLLAGCGKSLDSSTTSDTDAPLNTSSVSSDTSDPDTSTDSTNSSTDNTSSNITGNESNSGDETDEEGDGSESDVNQPDGSEETIDPNAPTVYLTAERSGSTVTVHLNVKNNPGVAAYTIKINYDKQKVTPKTITGVLTSPIVSNLQQPNATLSGSVTAVYANTKGTSDDGEMFGITFDINDKAEGIAKFEIIADENDFVAPDYAYIIFQKQNVNVTID